MPEKEVVSAAKPKKKNAFSGFWRSLKDVKFSVKFGILFFLAVYATLFIVSSVSPALRDVINSWPIALRYVVSIVFAVGFILGGFALTMLVYLVIRRRLSHSKYMVEVVTVAAVFLLSWALKATVMSQIAAIEAGGNFNPTFSEVSQIILSSLYATFGGLQFEGLAYEAINNSIVFIAFYYGSSVLAGLIFISVIASKAAYEFYSRILLFFLKTEGKKIYIFTALNAETLNLAHSLVEEDRLNAKHDFLIIFCGTALEPFDRHDPLCVEVMAHGYIYWSVSARRFDTILKKIGLHEPRFGLPKWGPITVFAFDSDDDHIPNEEENMDFVLLDVKNRIQRMRKANRSRIEQAERYFRGRHGKEDQEFCKAFKAHMEEKAYAIAAKIEPKKGEDEATTERLYAERRILARKHYKKMHLSCAHISYYILTKRKVDYQAYQDKISRLEDDFGDLIGHLDARCVPFYLDYLTATDDNAAAKARRRCARYWREAMPFSIHVWNEADAIAQDAQRLLLSRPGGALPNQKQTWMWCFGFGATGQSLAKTVYTLSSNVDKDGNAATFLCDVFDPEAGVLGGLTKLEIPLSVCLYEHEGGKKEREAQLGQYEALCASIYERQYEGIEDRNYEELSKRPEFKGYHARPKDDLFLGLSKELPLPCFYFHDYTAGHERMNDLLYPPKEQILPSTRINPGRRYPDYITISAGDDYASIRIANDLAAHFQEENLPHRVTLFVNVWDEKNNNLVLGFNRRNNSYQDPRIIDFGSVCIIIVGNNEEIYRSLNILESQRAIDYNYMYNNVGSIVYEGDHISEDIAQYNRAAHAYFRSHGDFRSIPLPQRAAALAGEDAILSGDAYFAKANDQWYSLILWKRVSSAAAYRFAPVYASWFRQYRAEEDLAVFLTDLARVEHQRWMRFHIVDGWRPKPKKDETYRFHDCLLPMDWINHETLCYDLFNVLMGIATIDRAGLNKALAAYEEHNNGFHVA